MKKENKLIVAAVVLPFLVGAFFSQTEEYKLNMMHFIVLTTLIVAYNAMLYLQKAEWEYRKTVLQCSVMGFVTIGLIQGICLMRQTEIISEYVKIGLETGLAVIMLTAFLVLLKQEKGVTENVIMLVIFAGFMVRVFYVVLTTALLFQNDVTALHPDSYGHLGYVYQLYVNGKLPDIDPTTAYEFYQPPLHYFISAFFLKVFNTLGLLPKVNENWAWEEILQVLPLIYSTITQVYIYKIAKQMKLTMEGCLAAVCFAGFLPYSIIMGGALNNDPLAMLFTMMCIYYTFRWYDKPDMKGILTMALCIGCAMMTKISAGLIAPAMAVMMLQRAWKGRKQWKAYLKQFVCFGIIAFPLGLWHSVYNYIKYEMPIGFVPFLGEDSIQFIGIHDKWSRFFDFERAFEDLSVRMDRVNSFADYNIPVTLIKYVTFGESRYYRASRLTNILGTGIFWVNAALFLLMVVMFVIWCFFKDGRLMQKVFMLTGAVVSIYSYLKFCIKYTHVCSMNVRYIMGAVYIGCIVIAAAASGICERIERKSAVGGRICRGVTITVPVLYAIAVILLKVGMEAVVF